MEKENMLVLIWEASNLEEILSKGLWKSLPYLYSNEYTHQQRFMNYMDNFLQRRYESRTIRFALVCEEGDACDASHINGWISAATRAGVEELHLSIGFKDILHKLPSCLFTCNSLVTLELITEFGVQFPNEFCFPNMKSMRLSNINFAPNFGCQLLKSPYLEILSIEQGSVIQISFTRSDNDHDLGILSRLNEAYLDLGSSGFYDEKVSILVGKLSNVKILDLSSSCIRLFRYEKDLMRQLPTFCNLKHLVLELCANDGDVELMASLFHCTPLLQSLHITFHRFDRHPYDRRLIPEQFDSLCLPPSLKWIRMSEFCGEENQVELLKLLLRNEVLEINVEVSEYLRINTLWLYKLRPSTSTCVLNIILQQPKTPYCCGGEVYGYKI